MQEDGWIKLRRTSIKRSNTRESCVSFAVSGAIMFGAFIFFSSLRLFPGLSVLLVFGVLVLWAWVFGVIRDLMWSAAVTVSVSRHPARAGESFRVRYTVGRPERVDSVVVTWEWREVAVFRSYDSSTFVEPFLVQTLDATAREGTIEVPADAMPSFRAKHVRIEWAVSVKTLRGTTPTVEDYPVVVLPSR